MMKVTSPGSNLRLDFTYWDNVSSCVAAASPTVTIRDPSGAVAVSNAALVPGNHIGHYTYTFAVPAGAAPGVWTTTPQLSGSEQMLEHDQSFLVLSTASVTAGQHGHPYEASGAVATHAATPHGGGSKAWKGVVAGASGDGDPETLARQMFTAGVVSPTPTNIAITVARCSFFKLDAALTVNRIRWYGVGATTNVYRVAIYRQSTNARLTAELPLATAANAWGAVTVAGGVALAANTLYFVAVSVNAIGTTAGVLACGPTVTASTGQQAVIPTSWPGSLDLDSLVVSPVAFAQFPVTAGALPATAPARVAQAAWTGGMPAFFLDSNAA